MSARAVGAGLCRRCARRVWLLSCLGDALETLSEDRSRLWPTLELDEPDLIAALARDEPERTALLERWDAWSFNRVCAQAGFCGDLRAACRHHCRYPARLRDDPLAPHALVLSGGSAAERWDEPAERKVVAFAGARTPSAYGVAVAGALASELAAAGVTVAGGLSGVGAVARAAAIEAGGSALCVATPALPGRDADSGGELAAERREDRVAELLESGPTRRWPALATERLLALVADLVLVVQAHDHPSLDLVCAEVARTRGVPVAAVPGPIDVPASRGANRLLATGTRVVCEANEALDALFGLGAPSCSAAGAEPGSGHGQQAVLDLLSAGERTLAELGQELGDESAAAVAAVELELSGLAVRGDDGRYRAVRAAHLP